MALCYARWTYLQEQEYRDQTIIKLDDDDNNWDLYASIILLNPGECRTTVQRANGYVNFSQIKSPLFY